ncbi:nitrilotriacetate monooxygenase component B [Drechmeria coniospora]|uniref:Nitrilotriacetate monooxygenase component B n=1 Tax=Drechmeria coniospora TaxID=98403 RepID=A0A151GHG2_DRECN|nr:nitrilotriacetate monooxygenase component B [Drechmeria coniospora]KYK56534.1 nitrilotriacetate monooxygenase component B [Drechmeria coniospora]
MPDGDVDGVAKREARPDFKKLEASRPPWDPSSHFRLHRAPQPAWKFGDGANELYTSADASQKHVVVDPYEPGRPATFNYKLLISAVTPRPIAFVSTRSLDGETTNLAPFSYFNLVNHDPPLFVVGFSCGLADAKDTLRNVRDTGEAVINIVSETFLEAANSTSIDAPYGASEWSVSGLTPLHDCQTVRCARVKEAVFSVEAKLDLLREYESRAAEGKKSGTVAIFEGTRMWVREDALNQDKNLVDPTRLQPVSRLGGITYGRTTEAVEIPRPKFDGDLGGEQGFGRLRKAQQSLHAAPASPAME